MARNSITSSQAGFTLIELVIVAGLLSMLLTAVSSMFMATITSNLKTSARQQIKEEGGYVLNQMDFLLKNARRIDQDTPAHQCATNMSSLKIVNADAHTTEFSISGTQIASNSAALHSSSLVASDLNFDCERNPSGEYYVDITFTLAHTTPNISEDFHHVVLLRNK